MDDFIKAFSFKKSAKLPLVLQDEIAECGHACLVMISNFWGHCLDMSAIRRRHKPSIRGVTLLTLKTMFEELGFMARAIQVDLNELSMVQCPAVLHWNLNHFVVLKKVKKNAIIIHDPATGLRQCSMKEASTAFTGIVLEIEKSMDFIEIREKNKLSLRALVKAVKGIYPYILCLLLLSLTIEVLGLLNPLFIQYITDGVVVSHDMNNLYVVALAFIWLVSLQFFTEYIRGNLVIYLSTSLTAQFSAQLMKHLLKLPLHFFEQRHKGDIQSRFQSIDQVQKKISTDFINAALDGLMVAANVWVMMIYSVRLTGVVIGALFLYFVLRYSTYFFIKKQTEQSIHQHAKAASLFLETLQSISPIKSFLKERVRFHSWRNAYIDSLNADIKINRLTMIYQVSSQFLFNLEQIFVVGMGAVLALSHQFSIGMLVAFLSYRLMLVSKASSFIQNLFDYKLISVQLNRLNDLVLQVPEDISTTSALPLSPVKGILTINNVSFKYNPAETYVLNKINLHIDAGEKVAIVGTSGCGKSTLLKVMMGLLPRTEGNIYIDGTSIEDFGLRHYRELTACVMQEDALISGSILENIAFFDEELDMEQVFKVAKLAYIHDAISQLPMGYETRIGELGSSLSGGQKQRLLLARALYKNPRILFLDEATSHLDVMHEQWINQSLKSLAITQVVIAHREETIKMADRVIRLESINDV